MATRSPGSGPPAPPASDKPAEASSGVTATSPTRPLTTPAGATPRPAKTATSTRPATSTPPTIVPDDSDAGIPVETTNAQWTTYGFDQRNTQTNPTETILGPATVARLKERWRLHMPDGATSTPAVLDGVAYFGGWNGHVYAVDAASGEIHWQRRVTQAQVNSTPLVTADRVYVSAGASLIALDRNDGATVFEVALDTNEAAEVWSSPKLMDDMLVIGVASFENGTTLQPTFRGSVVALEADTGEEVWRVYTTGDSSFGGCDGGPGAAVWSSAAFDEELGLAYIGVGQGYNEPVGNCTDSLIAIDYRRGSTGQRVRWVQQYTQDDVFGIVNLFLGADADVGGAPNLFEVAGRKLVGAGDKGGSYRAFDRTTGEPVWRTNLDMGVYPSFGGVVTTAAVSGDTIYVASNHIDQVQFLQGGEPTPSDSATLYALATATGQPRWQVQLPSPIAGTFAIANGVLYHPVVNRTFFARDVDTGEVLWSTQLQNDPGAGPSVVDGRVYVSAGMMLSGVSPSDAGGFVSCYELDAAQRDDREAPPDMLQHFTGDECRSAVEAQNSSSECAMCLCACDATAAGNCGQCTTIASCAVANCGNVADTSARKDCLANNCNAKLLPSFVFDRALDLTPCMAQCAMACGY